MKMLRATVLQDWYTKKKLHMFLEIAEQLYQATCPMNKLLLY